MLEKNETKKTRFSKKKVTESGTDLCISGYMKSKARSAEKISKKETQA